MFPKPLIFFVAFLTFRGMAIVSGAESLPFFTNPIPAQTPQPIDIESSKVKPITTPTPLRIIGNDSQKEAILTNTGYSIEFCPAGPSTTEQTTGGILGTSLYTYFRTTIYWTSSPQENLGTTVDEEGGTPMELWIEYYNTAYPSYTKALQERDGTATMIMRFGIGKKDNPRLSNLANMIEKIKNPGSSIKVEPLVPWHPATVNVSYFAYPGASLNESTNTMYFCSTTIVIDTGKIELMSAKQFSDIFSPLRGKDGKQLINSPKKYKQGDREVLHTSGIQLVPSEKSVPRIQGSESDAKSA